MRRRTVRTLLYGLSKDGSEDSILHILSVADGRGLAGGELRTLKTAGPQWLDDGSGFFYNQLTAPVATPERYLDSQARFHKLGADPASDPILSMKRAGWIRRCEYERIQGPAIATFEETRGTRCCCCRTCRSEMRILIAPVADAAANRARTGCRWRALKTRSPGRRSTGTPFICSPTRAVRAAGLLKASVTAPAVAGATEVVPQSEWVIEDVSLARGRPVLADAGRRHRTAAPAWP